MMTSRYRLVFSNTYGSPNVGDEAILSSMIDGLSSRLNDVEISVLSLAPRRTERNHPGIHVIESGVIRGTVSTLRAIRRANLLILGGGGILQDATSLSNLLFHLSRALAAYLLGTPFLGYALGIGPLNTRIARSLTAAVLKKAQVVLVRDDLSAILLRQIGVPSESVRVTADPALLLDFLASPLQEPAYRQIWAIKERAERLIGISLRPEFTKYRLIPDRSSGPNSSERFLSALVQVAKQLIDQWNAHFVFFSMHPEQDDPLGNQLIEQVDAPGRVTLVSGALSPRTIMSAVGLTDMFISMRLHSLIFAARSSVPMIALEYDPKVKGFMMMLGQENHIVPSAKWEAKRLLELVEDTWRRRGDIRTQIAARLPELQDRAKENADAVVELLSDV